ncbi:MAG: hypothetical protein ACR2GK_07585, partial [Gemmatimonadaceae bacterium]
RSPRHFGNRMANERRAYKGADGIDWTVEVRMPTASNAMVVFRYPGGDSSGLDRYSWHQWHGPESRSVTSRIATESVMKVLSDDVLALLFRRSMPVSPGAHPLAGVNV